MPTPLTIRTHTVAFELEIPTPPPGPCYSCADLYGDPKAQAIADIYADTDLNMFIVRNQDGHTSLVSCGRHLETITTMWDTIIRELGKE